MLLYDLPIPFLLFIFSRICKACKLYFNDWVLYAIDSPYSGNSRGFCKGSIYSKEGKLIASCTQEGLIRLWPESK